MPRVPLAVLLLLPAAAAAASPEDRCDGSDDVFESTLACQEAERWDACLEHAARGWRTRRGEENRRTLARYAAVCARRLCRLEERDRWAERACHGLEGEAGDSCAAKLEVDGPLCLPTLVWVAGGAAVAAVVAVVAVLALREPEVELVFSGRRF